MATPDEIFYGDPENPSDYWNRQPNLGALPGFRVNPSDAGQPKPTAPPPTGGPPPGGTHPYDPKIDPPKPGDPGNGQVYIWMGDHWGLTEPADAPYPSSGTHPTGGDYSPSSRTAPGPLNYPAFHAPTFTAPAPFSYDPFSYESFQKPTVQDAQNEPGFQFALQQGLKAMENSKAYLGTYRTGGTIKGLNDYARDAANQNYNDVFRRSGETYDRNRGNAFGNWSANRNNAAENYQTNYGISRDVFDRGYQGAKDEYAPQARAAELQFGRDWDQYAYEGDDEYRRWKAKIDAAAQVANG